MSQELQAPVAQPPVQTTDEQARQLADAVRSLVAGELAVESVELTRDPRRGAVVVEGRLLRPSAEVFPRWLAALNKLGYTPLLRSAAEPERVALHVMPGVMRRGAPRMWINLALFLLTVLSTLYAGAIYGAESVEDVRVIGDAILVPRNLLAGWPFSATLLGILAAHEFGHYFAARYHKVAVTLPYFIPMPFGFGTMGAVIAMREPVSDRRKLFDIGVAGPLAGLALAVPLLFVGLSTSQVLNMPNAGFMLEGNSIFYYLAKLAVFGRALPDFAAGQDVFMNQVTYAAWIGLLVTALNLLPLGQLDGGHTVFALFGERARYVNIAALAALVFLIVAGLPPVQALFPALAAIGYSGWGFFLLLILFVIGPFHPPTLDDVTRLNPGRRLVGYLVLLIFIVTFVPVPFRFF